MTDFCDADGNELDVFANQQTEAAVDEVNGIIADVAQWTWPEWVVAGWIHRSDVLGFADE